MITQKNLGIGFMLFALIGFSAIFYASSQLALATEGAQGLSYVTFETTAIDPSKLIVGRLATRADSGYEDSRACQVEPSVGKLGMRGCPLSATDSTGKLVYLQVEALKDFYGQDVRIMANINEGQGTFYIGDFETGNFVDAGADTGGENRVSGGVTTFWPSGQISVLLEVIPNELDPTHIKIFMNGQERGQLTLLQTEKLSIGFKSSTGRLSTAGDAAQPGSFDITKFNYEPQFGCDIRDGELLVAQTIKGGQNVGITDFEFDPIRFCEDHPVIIIDQEAQGSTTSYSLPRLWVTGQEVPIPTQQSLEVRYVMRNDDGTGKPIVPFICTNETYNLETKTCEPRIGTLQLCDGQLVAGGCLTRIAPEECPENAFLNEQGQCIERIPSTQVACEEGTINIVAGTCEPNSLSCDIGFMRQEVSPGRFTCVSKTPPESIQSTANDIAAKAIQLTAETTNQDKKQSQTILVATMLGLIFSGGFFLWWTSPKTGKTRR